jgi:hypothetical protein
MYVLLGLICIVQLRCVENAKTNIRPPPTAMEKCPLSKGNLQDNSVEI